MVSAKAHWLSESETAKMNRFHFEQDRQLYLVSHCLVRWALSLYADVNPKDLQFKKNKQGKPYLTPDCSLSFNLSHSHEWAVISVAKKRELGVDIELVDRRHLRKTNTISDIAKQFFHASESQYLETLKGEQKIKHFSQLWTLKESVLKAKGLGLSDNLSKLTFTQCGDTILVNDRSSNKTSENWHCFSFDNVPGYALSLAINVASETDGEMPAIKAYRVIPGEDIGEEIALSRMYLSFQK